MPGYKTDRRAEDIKREIIAVIRELKDPRVTSAILTVVRIELARDLSYGKVFVSSLDGLEKAKVAVKGLESATGLIRKEIGGRLRLRKTPELKFIADNSVESAIELFKKLNNNREDGDNEN